MAGKPEGGALGSWQGGWAWGWWLVDLGQPCLETLLSHLTEEVVRREGHKARLSHLGHRGSGSVGIIVCSHLKLGDLDCRDSGMCGKTPSWAVTLDQPWPRPLTPF